MLCSSAPAHLCGLLCRSGLLLWECVGFISFPLDGLLHCRRTTGSCALLAACAQIPGPALVPEHPLLSRGVLGRILGRRVFLKCPVTGGTQRCQASFGVLAVLWPSQMLVLYEPTQAKLEISGVGQSLSKPRPGAQMLHRPQ